MLDRSELDIIARLTDSLNAAQPHMRRNTAYYEGRQRLEAMGLSLPPEMQKLQTVVNWPAAYVNAIAYRQQVEGFRLSGEYAADSRFWDWWQANNLDEESDLAHLEALVQSRCYLVAGYDEENPGTPLITVESPENMYAEVDRRTRRVRAAIRLYNANQRTGEPGSVVLYLPNETVYADMSGQGWTETDRVNHQLGVVPVVPMVNRARIGDRHGRTEMADIMGLTDAACRTLTNLQGAQELMAVPQRYILGADSGMFQDANGDPVPTWKAYIANFLTVPADESGTTPTVGQFTAADLRNFTETLKAYADHVSAVTGLPAHYLGMTSANPASADAIRSSESRLVKLVERKNNSFGSAWEQIMRIGAMIVDGKDDQSYRRLETIWRNPATPTLAEKADAIRKLVGANEPLIDRQTALEWMGTSPEEVQKIMDRLGNDPMAQLLTMVGQDNGSGGIQQSAEDDNGGADSGNPALA